ncbi:hypothetical protein [Desmospora activa]|uniref:Uncharacterized protein n=1 Tax=Desmospora activa DSM 45169 TaxID=1121389 RepID=A0A2T4ZB62_9BACL|nr:hypothetical protein [Desmospora activa]PTM59106.1 hypothetical protein C8J48_1708 [Desmospora activa DSM 45169]
MKEQLIEQKLDLVKAEMGELSYQEYELITTGCEKEVLILDKKIVIAFFRDGLQVDAYGVRQELIRRLGKRTEAILFFGMKEPVV